MWAFFHLFSILQIFFHHCTADCELSENHIVDFCPHTTSSSFFLVALFLFTHTWITRKPYHSNSRNIFHSFEACFASQRLQLNAGCLETTQNLVPNRALHVLHPAGRRLATLLCKLRIIRESELQITPGTLDGERGAQNQDVDVVRWWRKASVDLICVVVLFVYEASWVCFVMLDKFSVLIPLNVSFCVFVTKLLW